MRRAAWLLTQKVDKIALDLKQDVSEQEKQENKVSSPEKMFYASVAYLQFADDTRQLDELKEKGDYKGLLTLAKEYYDGNGMDEQQTYASPLRNRGDDLLIEDKDFAVVYNGSVGGTYEVMLKYTEQEVRDHIRRYGTDRASDDVKAVARDMVAEQFAAVSGQKIPAFELPGGEVLYIGYNRKTDSLDVGPATNAGIIAQHSFPYDHNATLDDNLQKVHERLGGMEEYRAEEAQEEYYSGGMRR